MLLLSLFFGGQKMRLKALAIILAVAAIAALSAPALAQYQVTEKSRAGVSLGFMRPSSSVMEEMGSLWLVPSLHVNLTFDEQERANSEVAISWWGQEGANRRSNIVPVTASYIKRFGKDQENPWYAGGGAGIYFINIKGYEPTGPFGQLQYVSDNKTELGLHLMFGREFGGWYAELRSDLVSGMTRSNGSNLNISGLSLVIGSRLAL